MGYFGHKERLHGYTALTSTASLCVQGRGRNPYNVALSLAASVQEQEKIDKLACIYRWGFWGLKSPQVSIIGVDSYV